LTGATLVDFGTTPATGVTVVNSTTITADSPAGSGVVDVNVTTPGGKSATSSADQFTYVAFQTVTLSGDVFNDLNSDGTIDPGDTGSSGWTVKLLDSSNTVIATTITGATGGYSFTGVGPGTHTIEEVTQTGANNVPYVPTIPVSGSITLTPTSGTNQSGLNFGNILQPEVVDIRADWGTRSMSLLNLTRDLPFVDITAFDVIFNDNVVVSKNDLSLTSLVNSGVSYNFSGFSYNSTTHDGTWTLPTAVGIDTLMMVLDGTKSSSGTDGVHVNPGIYLGNDSLKFNLLPGDVNGDGEVNVEDAITVRNEIVGLAAMTVWADVEGDGTVDLNDYNAVKKLDGT
jgi:hypothetical protein